MNSQKTISNFEKIVAGLLLCLFAAASVQANGNDVETFAKISKADSLGLASRSLAKKLQNDLVLKSVSVKFRKIESYLVSSSQIGIKGEATCRLDGEANDLPVSFDVKIDVHRRAAADVNYVFLNMEGAAGAGSALTAEDVITEKLLAQIKNDYRTENIVIAIDFLEGRQQADGENKFTGGGEIRLNGLDWKKINFDVKADLEKAKVAVLNYQIK